MNGGGRRRSANQLDDAGNRIYRPAGRVRNASPFARLAAVPRLAMRFPATEYVASLAMVRSSGRLPPPFDRQSLHVHMGSVGRERRWSKQSKAARERQWTKRGADPLREDHTWSERHGREQQMSATRFAAPSFFVCGTGAHGRRRHIIAVRSRFLFRIRAGSWTHRIRRAAVIARRANGETPTRRSRWGVGGGFWWVCRPPGR